MNDEQILTLLRHVQDGKLPAEEAMEVLRRLPFQDLGFARIDTHRSLRKGFPEAIFCAGKTDEQIEAIAIAMDKKNVTFLATRVEPAARERLKKLFPCAEVNDMARTVLIRKDDIPRSGGAGVVIVTAGTSDIPVAEEAAVTADAMGQPVKKIFDVGVAGIHRLFHSLPILESAHAVVVAAGMEGALASIVGGLISKPVIAVPTSIGYGTSFKGLTPLLSMLNSCAPGIAVVNIDNGYGAGYMAALIASRSRE
jgi:NCAIR mutase (PurE)-related protein